MGGVVLSLISVGAFVVAGAAAGVLTLLRARSSARRRRSRLSQLNLEGHYARIDEALDRILAEERGALPGMRDGWLSLRIGLRETTEIGPVRLRTFGPVG